MSLLSRWFSQSDIAVIRSRPLPQQTQLTFEIPSFGHTEHVHKFNTVEQIVQAFGDKLLTEDEFSQVAIGLIGILCRDYREFKDYLKMTGENEVSNPFYYRIQYEMLYQPYSSSINAGRDFFPAKPMKVSIPPGFSEKNYAPIFIPPLFFSSEEKFDELKAQLRATSWYKSFHTSYIRPLSLCMLVPIPIQDQWSMFIIYKDVSGCNFTIYYWGPKSYGESQLFYFDNAGTSSLNHGSCKFSSVVPHEIYETSYYEKLEFLVRCGIGIPDFSLMDAPVQIPDLEYTRNGGVLTATRMFDLLVNIPQIFGSFSPLPHSASLAKYKKLSHRDAYLTQFSENVTTVLQNKNVTWSINRAHPIQLQISSAEPRAFFQPRSPDFETQTTTRGSFRRQQEHAPPRYEVGPPPPYTS